ncbi:hypothetical protein MYCO108962_23655 [Mycobacterium colombiense]|uniref:Uncharacterized protein n=1 Tax=Mycobacterium colombiense CECT 3035 TaxID=1041522 RepID=J5DYP7_9MYCO|nr:hypothetical protein [Mycobacterium colombiense]EJO86751.1 hypothetical protein MCOL_V222618 [Mycobacterium colombiense CECT 3035]
MSAGDDLRAGLDAALAREAKALGRTELVWDEREAFHVDAACAAADSAEILAARIEAAATDPGTSHSDLVRLLAERRQQLAKAAEHLRWLSLPHALSAASDPQKASAGVGSGRSRRTGRPGAG